MNILITGSSGLIGSALLPFLSGRAHRVIRLVRRIPHAGADEISWDPDNGNIDTASMEGSDAVVHLAGESIAAGRWTPVRKRRILDSRVKGTELLSRTLATLQKPPRIMIATSAVGFYGDRGSELLNEDSGPGTGFLAEVCLKWERAAGIAAEAGIRVVMLRLGMVLSASGGALRRMLPPFRLGIGGRLGSGQQYVGWIAMDDLLEVIPFAFSNPSFQSAINTVAPGMVTNLEFTKALGNVLGRPTVFPLPAMAIRLMFGEMGEQVLLASARVYPTRLTDAGFRFQYPDLMTALRRVLAP